MGMYNARKIGKRRAKVMAIVVMTTALLLSACTKTASTPSGKVTPGQKEAPFKINVMLPAFSTDLATKDSPILQKLNELTNTEVEPIWVPSTAYEDKFNITLSSGQLPTIMAVLSKSPSFVNAAQAGAFWEVGPYLKDYKYLSQANPVVVNNSSINGKVYGIYRSRPLGRNGVSIRQEWLDNLGLPMPKTVDEFYQTLKAFTEKDPDKNGKNDTYGLVLAKSGSALDTMAIWFGVPNKWGEDKTGKLIPAHFTPQYMEATKFFRKLYSEKLINQDFAILDPAKLDDPVKNGQAGVQVGVLDNTHRLQDDYESKHPEFKTAHPDGKVTIFTPIGAIAGPDGKLRANPTSGYAGILAIPKSSVPKEADLKKVLAFLDSLNSPELQTLIWAGIEGQNYTKKDDYMIRSSDKAIQKNIQDLNQMQMGIPGNNYLDVEQTPLRKLEAKIQTDNEKIVVSNPAESFVSKVYGQKGAQLDNILNDARLKYIIGQIDDNGWNQAMELWSKSGGDDYTKEINELYAQFKKGK
jgi:putative aldouronate transport system substrate-binding protein